MKNCPATAPRANGHRLTGAAAFLKNENIFSFLPISFYNRGRDYGIKGVTICLLFTCMYIVHTVY